MTRIRAKVGFTKTPNSDILTQGRNVCDHMDGNPSFLYPPVAMADLKEGLDRYADAITEGLDGGRTAVTALRSQRVEILRMLRVLGRYAESTCDEDMTVFVSSGFQVASTTRVPSKPLPQPTIRRVVHGTTGQLLVKIRAVAKAKHYELRHSALGDESRPGAWTTEVAPRAMSLVPIHNLKPGTVYAVQVRAFGSLGYTDWSDSVTLVCA